MKHVLDALRDALPVVATLRGDRQVHIPAGVGIKVLARQVAGDRAIVLACPDSVLKVGADQVLAAAAGLGVDTARFERYADRRWGPEWMNCTNGRHQALNEIERYRNDPEGFADKIDAHLNLPGPLA